MEPTIEASTTVTDPDASCEALPRFERYQVHEVAGRGGMGVVFRATDRATGRPVAIKMVSTELAPDADFVERLEREAALLGRLTHPGVVRLIERLSFEGAPCLVLEWVDGLPLSEQLPALGLPPRRAAGIVCDLLEILDDAHSHGIVHRDVKPHNVLVGPGGNVKLGDFGLAVLRPGSTYDRGRLTGSQTCLGSADYMAPEQRRSSRAVDHRADLYSAGVVLYQLLTGELPVGKFSLPSACRPDIPVAVDTVVLRALEADPARRYAAARDMGKALREAAEIGSAGAIDRSGRFGLQAGATMRAVPAGTFLMGDPRTSLVGRVAVGAFWVDAFPVTNAEYRHFVERTGYPEPRFWLDTVRSDVSVEPQMPVVGVSWHDAASFARWAGKRLPTEAEWERAARGDDGRMYPWGDEPDPARCNCRDSGPGRVTASGAYRSGQSPYAVEDMLGNVLEWTSSLELPYPYDPSDGREDPSSPGKRVLRGGSWYSDFDELSCWARKAERPSARMPNIGFRCVSDLGPSR